MDFPFMETEKFLLEQHIIVSKEWIKACIAFVRQEHGNSMSTKNLKKSVYQQWLVADLEEIACSALPRELPTVQKTTLDNNFALQVQGIRDISRPAYSQLKQLAGSVNCNEEFSSAPKEAIPEWEAKPTRMLLLNLTDGCTQIQGMEYRPIRVLSPNLSPGIKVLIKGPIECRFGVLLLTSDNISILGGEVESKSQQYSRENILKEQLQIDSNNSSQEVSAANSIPVPSYQASLTTQTLIRNPYPRSAQLNENDNISSLQTPSFSSNLQSFERNTEDILEHFESDDDFEQNIDYEALDEIENSQRPVNTSTDLEIMEDDNNIWQEDEDMIRDMMEFQDRNEDFKMPFEPVEASTSKTEDMMHDMIEFQERNEGFKTPFEPVEASTSKIKKYSNSECQEDVFSYLSSIINNSSSNCVITIKGFIISVLSKLECTPSKGWSLTVKINDGTASVDASIHDKVLEEIIGVSAQDMRKKQVEAAKNIELKKEVMQIISKFKLTLQNYNCLMDVKFNSGEKPCIVRCYPVSKLHLEQLLERVRSSP